LIEFGFWSWKGVFLGNYRQVLLQDDLLSALGTSTQVALLSSSLSLIAGSLAAYGLVRFDFFWKKPLTIAVFCARLISPVALVVPLFFLLKTLGLTDTPCGLALAHTATSLPFTICLLMPFFQSIPQEIEQAAEIDGCTAVQTFRWVVLPLVRPGLVVAGIFSFLMSWNDFLFALILGGSDTSTAPLAVHAYLTGFVTEWGPMAAASVCVLFPVFFMSLFLQKQLISGATAGAVK
jgi:multiple sugar transport system permease protein